jgi:hypothetical protein
MGVDEMLIFYHRNNGSSNEINQKRANNAICVFQNNFKTVAIYMTPP